MKLYAMHGAGSIVAEIMMEDMEIGCDIVYPTDNDRQSAAFRAISPYGRIPVLVTDDGQPVFESLAIILMLLQHYLQIFHSHHKRILNLSLDEPKLSLHAFYQFYLHP